MSVESTMEVDDPSDSFPIGMRVLAVDDDPTFLLILETLLRKCQYHVTATTQAKVALKLLRENKNKFDLVITDVHMPDMDGFKLLELIGLEMDLPVVMVSINGDTKLVMKGVSHGACDYLLKPVRMEELQNIWQHVFRRKIFDPKKNKINNSDKPTSCSGKGEGSARGGNSYQNGMLPNRRKDHGEDEVDNQENPHDDQESSSQKKPRVVWSVELHRKFIAAVTQLGIEKVVPKRILELMNDENLTRENVASHLQKYRHYLKHLSQANQHANTVAALGSVNSSYSGMDFVSGNGHLQTPSGSEQFHNNAFRSFPPGGIITSRLNNHASLQGVHGFPSPGVLQSGLTPSSNSTLNGNMDFNFSNLLQMKHDDFAEDLVSSKVLGDLSAL